MNGSYTHAYDSVHYVPAAPVLSIQVTSTANADQSASLTALVDTGADATMLPGEVLRTVGAQFLELREMRGITGERVTVETYLCSIIIGTFVVRGLQVIGTSSGTEAILGRDAISELIVTLNGLANTVEVTDRVR